MKISDALIWEEVGSLYGGIFRTKPMDRVFKIVKQRDDIYFNEEEGTLHKILEA